MIRNFTLTNALGASFSLMNAQQGAFFEPQGLGYDDVTQYEQVGEFFAPLTQRYGQQVVTGSMVFGSKPYEHYLAFTKFCQHAPLSLVYETDAGTFQIPCRLTKIEKGDTDGWTYLNCKVEFTALARMYKTVVANNTGTVGGGKEYFEKSYPDVSGSIVTIMDNTSTQTTLNLSADINPIQDLNGYDAPWVGGAGVNKYNTSLWEWTTSRRIWGTNSDSLTAALNTLPAGTYTIVGKIEIDSLTQGDSGDRTYGFLCTGVSVDGRITQPVPTVGTVITITKTFTLSSANVGNFTNCYWYGGSGTAANDNCTVYDVGLNVGSETNFAPYSNICPISGHTEVGVSVVGKNLAKLDANSYISAQSQSCTISYVDGGLDFTVTGTYARAKYQFSTVVGREYTLSFKGSSDADYRKVQVGNVITWGHSEYGAETLTSTETLYTISFTATSDVVYVGFYISASSTTGTATIRELQLELSPTATTFEPYNGQTYTTALGTTVYGGTLDVVSGVLTVDMEYRSAKLSDMSSLGSTTNTDRYRLFSVLSSTGVEGSANWVCDSLTYSTSSDDVPHYYYSASNNRMEVYVPKGTSTDTEIVWCGKLATPTTTQLTPQQIELLLGTNYVWANSGDVYLSNLKTYGYIYDYVYGDFVADTVTIGSDSTTSSPCRISIFGECTQPTWRHYLDGNSVATGYYNGTIPSGHKLVIDTTSSPYSIEEQDIAGNLIADRYELCDFSTERFFLLEYGHNTISVSHTDPDSIRLTVEGYIFYETV